MKTHLAIEKLKAADISDREEGAWELYINALHSFKALSYYAKNEKDGGLRVLLNSMVDDFKVLHDKENN